MSKITPERLAILRQDRERYETELRRFASENRTNRSVEREVRELEKRYEKAKAKMTLRLFEQKKTGAGCFRTFL